MSLFELSVHTSPLRVYEQLMLFARERGQDALLLAMHAAVPQNFCPDLLHLLRLNFLPGVPNGGMVETDVVLAPFCEDMGGDYFQFEPTARRLLLENLLAFSAHEPVSRIQRIANFLVWYVEQAERVVRRTHDPLWRHYLETQRWVALAFLNPDSAAIQLAQELQKPSTEGKGVIAAQLGGLASSLATPLARYHHLLIYAVGLQKLELGEIEQARQLLTELGDEDITVGEVTLPSASKVLTEALVRHDAADAVPSGEITAEVRREQDEMVAHPIDIKRSAASAEEQDKFFSEKLQSYYYINYANADESFALQLYQTLKEAGQNPWIDQQDVGGEESWHQAINRALQNCSHMILVWSKEAEQSREVESEWSYFANASKPLIIVRRENQPVHYVLQPYPIIDFMGDFDEAFKALVQHLEQPRQRELDSPQLAAEALKLGDQAFSAYNYTNAIKNYNRAISLSPDNAAAFFRRGRCYYHLGDLERASQDFQEALAHDPTMADAYYHQGLLLRMRGEHPKALAHFDKVAELAPQNAQGFYYRGLTHDLLGEPARAMQDYSRAIEIDPNTTAAYGMRGTLYFSQGKYQEALQDLDRAISLNTSDAVTWLIRGKTWRALGQISAALKDYIQALRLDDTLAEAFRERGTLYAEQGNHDAALDDLNQAIRLNPADGLAYLARADVRLALRNLDRAQADYDEAIRLLPDSPTIYHNRGVCYLYQNNHEQALEDFNRVIRLDPRHATAFYNRANAHVELGQLNAALADYDTAINLKPDDANALLNRGVVYQKLALYDEALADFTRVLSITPTHAEAYYNRHLIYLQRDRAGDDRLAKNDIEQYRRLTASPSSTRPLNDPASEGDHRSPARLERNKPIPQPAMPSPPQGVHRRAAALLPRSLEVDESEATTSILSAPLFSETDTFQTHPRLIEPLEVPDTILGPEPLGEALPSTMLPSEKAATGGLFPQEQYQLLMNAIRLYADEWKLAGIRSRKDPDILMAYLTPRKSKIDLKEAISRQEVLVIKVDPQGNTEVVEPKRRRSFWRSLTNWLYGE